MTACVLDASFTFQWLFADEASREGDAALELVARDGATVPDLWATEITNGLGMAERRGRLLASEVPEALDLLRSLPLTVAETSALAGGEAILMLMRTHHLTAYDATYLDIALREHLPLATRDRKLCRAAEQCRVTLLQVVT